MRGHALRNLRPRSAASQLRHGSHGLREAARNNVLEITQVGRDVERETVRCDPSADVHAYRADLGGAHPDSRTFRDAGRLDPEIRQRVDHGLLDRPHVGAHVALPFTQVQDGIADDLPWPVIGDVAAAVRGIKGDAGARQDFFAGQKIFQMTVAAERDGVGVLQQDDLVGDCAGLALRHQPLLPFKRLAVLHAARFPQFAPRGARTRACRVETRLDTSSGDLKH
jgi:hypothetical protein